MYEQMGSNNPILNKFFEPSRNSPGTSLEGCIRKTLEALLDNAFWQILAM